MVLQQVASEMRSAPTASGFAGAEVLRKGVFSEEGRFSEEREVLRMVFLGGGGGFRLRGEVWGKVFFSPPEEGEVFRRRGRL